MWINSTERGTCPAPAGREEHTLAGSLGAASDPAFSVQAGVDGKGGIWGGVGTNMGEARSPTTGSPSSQLSQLQSLGAQVNAP